MRLSSVLTVLICLFAHCAIAQERAYFVTYDHYLEERGTLEIAIATTTGFPKGGDSAYTAPWLELEYGLTGWRWENRFRPLKTEHRINPVIYVEYENINEASRIQKEIVGSGRLHYDHISELREEHVHELEGKLILSSAVRGWNIAENFVIEKNMSEDEGLEFGYSVGVSRSLGGLASGTNCHFCRENFVVGAELYGGLGSSQESGLTDTRHYIAPVFAWHVSDKSTFKVSTGFGLTNASDRVLLRVGYAYELPIGGR